MNRWCVAALLVLGTMPAQARERYAPVGLFIGTIEEGARIFTPARLLPLDHPDALGHDFPTVQQLRGNEFPALVWLGEQAGYRLWPTLQRYPTEPSPTWPYPAFREPPDSATLSAVTLERRTSDESPLPGLRAVLFDDDEVVLFIVDTRSLTLAERGMARATAMGLDVTRAEFLAALGAVATPGAFEGLRGVVFER